MKMCRARAQIGCAWASSSWLVLSHRSAKVAARPAQTPPLLQWYKGNTHTHTLNSDGDSTPDDVVRWYREHGYRFLVLSDHNFLTSVDGLNALHGADDPFLVIKGEEVSDRADAKPIHINGLDVSTRGRAAARQLASSTSSSATSMRFARPAASRTSTIPNFEWAISADEMQRIERTRLFELYNGHHLVNNLGGGGVPGMEEVWDRLLSSGKVIYGIADDDAHVFKQPGNPDVAGPGTGVGCRPGRAARAAADCGGARARRLLFVHRCRAQRLPGD